MEYIETLIPDNEGNHLVVALGFYDKTDKSTTFHIPEEFASLEIADISINKIDLDKPLNLRAFFKMCQWLIDQISIFPNAVFSFVCSTDYLETHHQGISPELYRWNLFNNLYIRCLPKLLVMGIDSKDIIVGPDGYQTFAKVFYRTQLAPIIHIVAEHLHNKYRESVSRS